MVQISSHDALSGQRSLKKPSRAPGERYGARQRARANRSSTIGGFVPPKREKRLPGPYKGRNRAAYSGSRTWLDSGTAAAAGAPAAATLWSLTAHVASLTS